MTENPKSSIQIMVKTNSIVGESNLIESKNIEYSRVDKAIDKDKHNDTLGFFRRAIAVMPKPLAVICCILNIIIPGSGTFLSSFSVFSCATHKYQSNAKSFLINLLAFVLQLLSAPVIFGWIWSIKYGLMFIHLSKTGNKDLMLESNTPIYARRHSSNLDLKNRINYDEDNTGLLQKLKK